MPNEVPAVADETKPEAAPLPRQSVRAELIDAGVGAVDKVSRFSPQQFLNVALIALVAAIVVMVIADRDERREDRRERQEDTAARVREFNAQSELQRQQSAVENEKTRMHCASENDKTRRESGENVKSILDTFLRDGEKNRTFWAQENERREKALADAIRGIKVSGP